MAEPPSAFGLHSITKSLVWPAGTAKTLEPIVAEMVKKGAHLVTESSNVLAGPGTGSKHDQVNHSAGEYVRREKGTLISANSLESYFATLKRGQYAVHDHWSEEHLRRYLREFDWRYNVQAAPDIEHTVVLLSMVGAKRLFLKAAKDPTRP